jgi:hypothetical protein
MTDLKYCFLVIGMLCLSTSSYSQIEFEFCPINKTFASNGNHSWGGVLSVKNNTGQVLDLANNSFSMNWKNLTALSWPFANAAQVGDNWTFMLNVTWPGILASGASTSVNVNGSGFQKIFNLPQSGTYTEGSNTFTVTVKHCNQTEAYELYEDTMDFDRSCFITSPTSKLCFGEAATEVWQGEGVFDVMVPIDKPSWAIGTMVAHRLFVNLVGADLISPNFFTAIAMNESRMTCDPSISPNVKNHYPINSLANLGTGVSSNTDNCFQMLNIGFTQIQNNQPNLFSQTNQYGTSDYNSVISGGKYEMGALALAHYHYQNIKLQHEINCNNLIAIHEDSNDPYVIEKILYHGFHDGTNAARALVSNINANYNAAMTAVNMNTVITENGTWNSLGMGSQKVANFVSLLDGGNGALYPDTRTDYTTEYYGCYQKDIKWTDVQFYLDTIRIMYPVVGGSNVQGEIKAVFDGLNAGADVPFMNFGPVIDEIVIQMGGHNPSIYLANQYSTSSTCTTRAKGVSLVTGDTICHGGAGILELWMSGDTTFSASIKFPNGEIKAYQGINHSPYLISVSDPGQYELVAFSDANGTIEIDCDNAKPLLNSKNNDIIQWDRSNYNTQNKCSTGDLLIKKTGTGIVTLQYEKDGVPQTDIVLSANELSKTIATGLISEEFIITGLSPNVCGDAVRDTIKFCNILTSSHSASAIITNLYPNPTSHSIRCVFEAAESLVVKISDSSGRNMLTKNLPNKESRQISIDVSSYPKGIYVLSAVSLRGTGYKTFVVR